MLLFEPGESYIAVSITGFACSLMCDYCRGRWLRGMLPTPTPEALERLVEKRAKKLTGILVSGGFDAYAQLPFEPFLETLARIKKRHPHLIISMHTGLVRGRRVAETLSSVIDVADYEVPVSRAQLRAMHLEERGVSITDFVEGALLLREHGVEVAPHFLLGLPGSTPEEEIHTIRLTTRALKPEVAVLLYYTGAPPNPRAAYERLRRARRAVYAAEASLGCMRPMWMRRRDELYAHLFDRIANPSRSLREKLGARPLPYCCSVPRRLMRRASRV